MLIGYYTLARSEEERVQQQHGEPYLLYKQRTAMFIPGKIGERITGTIFGWMPSTTMRGYAALVLLLVVGLTGSFFLRAASIKKLHQVALANAELVFLDEPPGVSESKIESEITRLLTLADQPARKGSVPLFYVFSKKGKLHHLLLDSGVTRDALNRSKFPEASWYLVAASASYCSSAT
jgi:hypothetical protein